MTIVRPTSTYGCEVWPIAMQIEQKSRSIEIKILRTIYGPVFDSALNSCRRKKKRGNKWNYQSTLYKKLSKGQRIQWFGHPIRGEETNEIKASIEWQPTGRRAKKQAK